MKRQRSKVESVEFRNMAFAYDDDAQFFDDVNFSFPTETVVWIRGESGAGKSSLLKIMAGLEVPTYGKYMINGKDVGDMSFEEFLPYRLGIGFSFDIGGLINNRTLFDNLMLPIMYHDEMTFKEAQQWVTEILEQATI